MLQDAPLAYFMHAYMVEQCNIKVIKDGVVHSGSEFDARDTMMLSSLHAQKGQPIDLTLIFLYHYGENDDG